MPESTQKSFNFNRKEPEKTWPPQDKFPLNEGKRTVKEQILRDIESSEDYLIITGFTSLANIIETFGREPLNNIRKTRILLGYEPHVKTRKRWFKTKLEQEIKDYWIGKGIDILQGGAVIQTIEHIKSGNIEFKIKDKLHAKLYVGDSHAILGSSNFSKQGTSTQQEANIRVTGSKVIHETNNDDLFKSVNAKNKLDQYNHIKQIAENFWEEGIEFDMPSLLEQLLQQVPWQHALARSIAEIIEGNWISDYPEFRKQLNAAKLWPYQVSGLAKSMLLLNERGSVLVADPTGSGKTRMITSIILALIHKLWETGRRNQANSLVLCPKAIMGNWEKESLELGFLNHEPFSIGLLSRPNSRNYKKMLDRLKLANILSIDEAHNFLSKRSNRSDAINKHAADYIILSTATPINKKAEDLIRLIELLGPDNLEDEELADFKALYKTHFNEIQEKDIRRLNTFIQKFILRRTKKNLNVLINAKPSAYLNKFGDPAQFPKVINKVYKTADDHTDREIANQIHEEAAKLKGIIYLQSFKLPFHVSNDDNDNIKSYYDRRLGAARAFTAYHIRNRLRSSRVALVEHIAGTDEAKEWLDIKQNKAETGNMISKLEAFKTGRLPQADFPSLLPDYLKNEKQYLEAIDIEIKIYHKIISLAKKMSDKREQGKATKILKLLEKHQLVLVFDSTVLTLNYMQKIIKKQGYQGKVHVVSGSSEAQRETVQELFGIDSKEKEVLALCSDVMSEGVNLQRAKAVVLLDMPSVLRLAEQRIGRLQRMDSPYKEIYAYWPQDPKEFALKADKRLIKTTLLTDRLIGGNLDLPKEFLDDYNDEIVDTKELIKDFDPLQGEEIKWEGLTDAFQPIYDLKEGDTSLINSEIYDEIKNSEAQINCKVSFVKAYSDWAFICIKGHKNQSPYWLFIDEKENITREFPAICEKLRIHLSEVESAEWNDQSLHRFIHIFRKKEREAIPPKKRRALDVAEHLLKWQYKSENEINNRRTLSTLSSTFQVENHKREVHIDYNTYADMWLTLLSSMLKERQEKNRKRELITLEDLKVNRKRQYFKYEDLEHVLKRIPVKEKLDNRIAACIVGVKQLPQ